MNGTMSLNKSKDRSASLSAWARYWQAMKYAGHVILHPFDGFWDMAHEHKGSVAAATSYLALFLRLKRTRQLGCGLESMPFAVRGDSVVYGGCRGRLRVSTRDVSQSASVRFRYYSGVGTYGGG